MNAEEAELALKMAFSLFNNIKHGDADHQKWLLIESLRWTIKWIEENRN